MKLRSHNKSLPLILFSSIAGVAATPPTGIIRQSGSGNEASPKIRGAFIDGNDGRPHSGPWVEVESHRTLDVNTALGDGHSVPDPHPGALDDPNRSFPKLNTMGNEGAISVKLTAREAIESETGTKVERLPETPKQAAPLPQSEQEKIVNEKVVKEGKPNASVVRRLNIVSSVFWSIDANHFFRIEWRGP
jgi:hypothetical protein